MTEESSADDADREPDADDVDEDELAPARSEEDPDVDAAREELEAIGRTDEENEDDLATEDDLTTDDDLDSENERIDGAGEADADAPDDESLDQSEQSPDDEPTDDDGAEDDSPNPEDLVRDPDEPQVTSSLDEAEAEAEAGVHTGADGEAGTAESDAETAEPRSEAAEPRSETVESEAESDESDTVDPESAPESPPADGDVTEGSEESNATDNGHQPGVPDDVQKYDRFKKVDGSQYDRVNEFLRDRTYITAREWAIARLCSDFRTETGVEMTKIGNNLPELVPFMTDTYTPQAVNQARSSFEDKVRTAGATFLYGAMCDFFTAEELDDVMYEATEVAKFLLEVEGVELSVEDELEAEDRISAVMREVRSSSAELRHERCPECGAELSGGE